MASPAYEKILDVQALDLNLTQLRHRHANHPARQSLVELNDEREQLLVTGSELDERHHDLERQRKRFEDEAALIKDRRDGIDKKLYGGEVTASKELLALQDEAASLKQQQTDLEDQELELMEQLDALSVERDSYSGQMEALDGRITSAEQALAEHLTDLDSEIETVDANREVAATKADASLLDQYEKLRPLYDGVAVAKLTNGSCDGCHIHLSAVALDQLMKLPEETVVTCEECGRMLVR